MILRLFPIALLACSSEPTKRTGSPPAPPQDTTSKQLVLAGGLGGIGFDDLRFSPTLNRVLVPAGRTGKLALIDPQNQAIESIDGFSSEATFEGGHGEGTTSVDEGAGHLFATDRGRTEVAIIDPVAKKIIGTAKLAAGPDYVRWVEPLREIWVTEPRTKQIEYFTFDGSKLSRSGGIEVPGGPESLVIDAGRGRAYTHTWEADTVVIDLAKHEEVARWKTGCAASRGIALDEAHGLLFVGCEEGKTTALDVVHDGKQLGMVETGKGVDIIAFAPTLSHLYVPGGDSATLTIVGVDAAGELTALGTVPAAEDAHCVTTDDHGRAYVCDPKHGAVLVISDPYPASRK